VIRLGSLAGYAFSGPRLLGGWTPPAEPGVYVILYKPDPERERYAVIYAGHTDDLSAEGFPAKHPRAACWARRAGSRWKLHIATLAIPGGGRGHREMVVTELISVYSPHCNAERFDGQWREEWLGEYSDAPNTAPMPRPERPAPPPRTAQP
jgi:hypothetical protein